MSRELTAQEKKKIKQSVIKQCANYDSNYQECLYLKGSCYMMTIGFTDSRLCKYYENIILPEESEIAEILERVNKNYKHCPVCDRQFIPIGNKKYCSSRCSTIARKRADAKRSKKYRKSLQS